MKVKGIVIQVYVIEESSVVYILSVEHLEFDAIEVGRGEGRLPVQVHSEFALFLSEGIIVVTSLLDPGTFVNGLIRENVKSFCK